MNCCSGCFSPQHAALHEFIGDNGEEGDCDICGRVAILVLPAEDLRELFEPLLELYEPDPDGDLDSLSWLANDDFDVTSEAAADRADDLFEAIFRADARETGEDFGIGGVWRHRQPGLDADGFIELWETFARGLQHERRYLVHWPAAAVEAPHLWLPQLLPLLYEVVPVGTVFYRTRSGRRAVGEMGAPSEGTSAGRANPAGIVFLYLSSDERTAVAEKRPWRGQILSVAAFPCRSPVGIVDLSEAPVLGSPFGLSEGRELSLVELLVGYRVLKYLHEVLSHPVDPRTADVEYVPTQYLTEIIRDAGYGGLRFKSALGPGHNLVLFDPQSMVPEAVRTVEVLHIHYEVGEAPPSPGC